MSESRRNSHPILTESIKVPHSEPQEKDINNTVKRLTEENMQLLTKIDRLESLLQRKSNNSKIIIKSGLGKDEEMMKLEIQSPEEDLPAIKSTLLKQITNVNSVYETLVARCDRLKEILSIFQANIQFNESLFLKQTEISKLNELMKKLSETIATTSRTEIELGMKTRELDKKMHEYGVLMRQHQTVTKRNEELERQVEELRQSIKILNDVQARNVNLTIAEKNKSSLMAKRMDVLEKNILSMKEPEKLFNAPDSTQKVRNTFNALIKENQELRKKIKGFENEIKDRDRQMNKQENRILNLEKKIRESTAFSKGKAGAAMLSMRTTGHYHKVDMAKMGFFPPSVLSFEKEAVHGLSYKLNILQEEYWKLLADIGEYGSNAFAQNTMEQDKDQQRFRVEFITDQYLCYKDFSERLNLLGMVCQLLYQNRNAKKIQTLVDTYMPSILSAESVHLWLVDFHANEICTLKENKEIHESAMSGLMGEIISSGNAFNESNSEEYLAICEPLKGNYDSQFIYPIKSKDGRIIAVIQAINSQNGVFAADEEYIVRVLSEVLSYTIASLGSEESFYLELHRHELVEQFQLALLKAKCEQEISNLVSIHINEIFSGNSSMIIFVKGESLIKYPKNANKDTEPITLKIDSGVCSEIVAKRTASLVIRAQCHPKYNGELDISTALPIYYIPLFKTEYFYWE